MKMKFKITKNKHYSNCWLYKAYNFMYKLFIGENGKVLSKKIKFSPECVYSGLEDDVNKLYGFSITNLMGKLSEEVHDNSARFGWRPNLNGMYMDIFAYYYIDGVRKYNKICSVLLDKFFKYKVEVCKVDHERYQFKFEVVSMSNNIVIGDFKSEKFKIEQNKYNLLFSFNDYPYFGGNIVAPHDMYITFID